MSNDCIATAPVLQAQDLKREYSVSRGLFAASATLRALDGVSFGVRAGQTLAVVGESGCGKSTLARLLTMIEPPTRGTLQLVGQDVASAGAAALRTLRREVQIVFQNPYGSLNPRQTVGGALMEPLAAHGLGDDASRRAQASAMLASPSLEPSSGKVSLTGSSSTPKRRW